ncbi:hypothetical protein [Klebsiella pneumoniae]|uniref:hypothetical protein n=1 Tax=Klebsiella pneumoniae TaxID=573 RepID=UPI0025542403|nr:hypothetical protein [Klebsiella pneumoniae]EMA6998321.1 hypothetical protein [Shigella sonnei]MDK9893774.1 hypothetical protein [Klebsiella pneumoniae]
MIEESRNIATQWRQANQEHMGGVVLLWQGAAYGWKNELRDPQHEQPGAVAVDETGCVFVAEGGNEYDGARCWVAAPANDPIQIARMIDGLNGKDFAMLTESELLHFRHLQRVGRKWGVRVWVEVLDHDGLIQDELAAASLEQREVIFRRFRTEVGVRWPD